MLPISSYVTFHGVMRTYWPSCDCKCPCLAHDDAEARATQSSISSRSLAGSEILRTAYGINVQSPEDPFIETAEHALHAMSMTANAGSYLVDIVPICEHLCIIAFSTRILTVRTVKHIPAWFPGAKFKRDAKTWKSYVDRMKDDPWAAIKGQMVSIDKLITRALWSSRPAKEEGSLPDCGALRLLEALERNPNVGYTETVIKQTLGSMYTGMSIMSGSFAHLCPTLTSPKAVLTRYRLHDTFLISFEYSRCL